MSDKNIKVIVVGGGLVGSLCACFMAKRGYEVTVYEAREDIRKSKTNEGRSINLALSHRGRKALRSVGLEDDVLKTAVPMKGRLLHSPSGKTTSVLYDAVTNECIYSVGRNCLNRTLLDAAEKYPNVKLYFNQRLVGSDFNEGSVEILNSNALDSHEDHAAFVIGADGAFSAVRKSMQTAPLFQFSQEYIEHGYIELAIPPETAHLMTPNHLHIWPRGAFMMIALPNGDNSWTVTLFMPFERFKQLDTSTALLAFFKEHFPDAIPLIGERELVDRFFEVKPSSLVSIKCKPHHVGGKFLLVGDAAHAMVPFYGQGMNAGFEDCSILDDLLDRHADNIEETVRAFSDVRVRNVQAICDLAMYNYEEMRDLVTRPSYKLRKKLDEALYWLFPQRWIPLYNSVSFSHMDYLGCLENRKWQDEILKNALITLGVGICGAAYAFS